MITENTTLKAVAIFKETSSGIMTEKYTKNNSCFYVYIFKLFQHNITV